MGRRQTKRNGSRNGRHGRLASEPWWADLPYDELLDQRLCDLELTLEGSALEHRVARLYDEFADRGLRFRPHVWLSTDWFTPDGIVGFAIPFYLAHPRLARIERQHMFEVEGGQHSWCMKLLRHEAGHAVDNAYRLHWRKSWRETFGPFSQPYHQTYLPKPDSRHFVTHLDFWYSQSHPAEDWAETFAVWLTPGSRWRDEYQGWPALRKLEYVDELMEDVRREKMKVSNRSRPEPLSKNTTTLRDYYGKRFGGFSSALASVYDPQLEILFTNKPGYTHHESASRFLRRWQKQLRGWVATMTGQSRYHVDQALKTMIVRCRELDLRRKVSSRTALLEASILLTVMTIGLLQDKNIHYHR